MKTKKLYSLLHILLALQVTFLASCDNQVIATPSPDTTPEPQTAIVTPGQPATMATPDEINSISYFNSLVIVNPEAVQAAEEVLSFATLMGKLAEKAGVEVAELDQSWVELMKNPQTVNMDTAEARFEAAEALSVALVDKSASIPLLAITNRIDLTKIDPASHEIEQLGEMHLVYELRDTQKNPLPYTVIMEFALPVNDANTLEEDLQTWAARWSGLTGENLATSAYRNELLALVTEIATVDNFLQMRTNENIDTNTKWEFRQFSIGNGVFVADVLPQTPSERYKETGANQEYLHNYVTENSVDFLNGDHDFSSSLTGRDMLGIRSMSGSTWMQQGEPSDSYFIFLANTCSGCHNEVNIGGNRHIFTNAAATTELSPFLTDEIPIAAKLSPNCVPAGSFSWCVRDEENNTWLWNESLRRKSLLACFAAGYTSCRISENSLVEESTLDKGTVIKIDGKPYH